MQTNLFQNDSPAFPGPYGINASLFDGIAAVPYEGLWVPLFGAKQGNLEINGSISSLSVQLWGTNVQRPVNGNIITVAGSIQATDTCAVTINSPGLPGGAVTKSHAVVGGDSVTTIAAALVASINSDVNLAGLGINASNVAGVITITWPSYMPGTGNSNPSGPPLANTVVGPPSRSGQPQHTDGNHGGDTAGDWHRARLGDHCAGPDRARQRYSALD